MKNAPNKSAPRAGGGNQKAISTLNRQIITSMTRIGKLNTQLASLATLATAQITRLASLTSAGAPPAVAKKRAPKAKQAGGSE